MKIKTVKKSYKDVCSVTPPEHIRPKKPNPALRTLMKALSSFDLKAVDFSYTTENMERAGKGPCLILMNHSSFLDLEIASRMIPMPYNIVCTSDGLVGKESIMRHLGCIPTQKFVTDVSLISDLKYAVNTNKTSVLMYPEASYSFDGTATRLPRKLGVLFKALKVPVVMITTYGSFARDPLYNNLQKRKVKVSAKMECLLTPEEIKSTSVPDIDNILDGAFSFDYFKWQLENHVSITENFRADGLNRILYKCPHCLAEGNTEGVGTTFVCHNCGSLYDMDEFGRLSSRADNTIFSHIPDWYEWERANVRSEVEAGTYFSGVLPVHVDTLPNAKKFIRLGSGTLVHDMNGFTVHGTDADGDPFEMIKNVPSLYSCHIEYEYLGKYGDCVDLNTLEDTWYIYPEPDKCEFAVTKMALATEELYEAYRRKQGNKTENVV